MFFDQMERARQAYCWSIAFPLTKKVFRLVCWAAPLALAGALFYQLSRIGWIEIWGSRPTSPAFYLCVLAGYFVQPLADLIIYRGLWKGGKVLPLAILLRKRQLNSLVFDYSGEAYFFLWAQRNLQRPKGELLHAIKDSNILSAAAGLTTALIFVFVLAVSGDIRPLNFDLIETRNFAIAAAFGTVPLLLAATLAVGGRKVTTLRWKQVVWTYGIHLTRSFTALALLFTAWFASGALPSIQYCFYVVALRVLISRLPLLPQKEIIFAGTTLAAAQLWDFHSQSIAAVLVVTTTVDDILGLLLVGIPWLLNRLSPWAFGSVSPSDPAPSSSPV